MNDYVRSLDQWSNAIQERVTGCPVPYSVSGCSNSVLLRRSLELAVLNAGGEGVPFAGGEEKRWAGGVFRVAHSDSVFGEVCNLDACIFAVASPALVPLGSGQVAVHALYSSGSGLLASAISAAMRGLRIGRPVRQW